MKENTKKRLKKFFRIFLIISIGILIGMLLSLFTAHMVEETSDAEFCGSCHSMEPMVKAYEQDVHGGNNKYGLKAKCVDCHLPHSSITGYMFAKTKTGMHDIWVETFGDLDSIDWEKKREEREHFVYDSGCLNCHKNLEDATKYNHKSLIAHKAYFNKKDDMKLNCVTCHEHVGHKNLSDHLK